MNAKENSAALVKQSFCGNEGLRVHVLFQEEINPILGTMWRVRFSRPVLVAPFSVSEGKLLRESLSISNEAILPDAWLMGLELSPQSDPEAGSLLLPADQMAWLAYAAPMEMDLVKPQEPPEVIEADLTWPDGWQEK